jgi:ABC transporter
MEHVIRTEGLTREFDVVGLLPEADHQVSEFSGGMLKRLDLACGLLQRPEVLTLDEPTLDDRRDQLALAAGRAGERDALRALRIAPRYSTDPDTAAEAQELCRTLGTPATPGHDGAATHLPHHEDHG